MSLSEIQAALPTLSVEERATLHETLYALEEGISIEEWRAMNSALAEELGDPSPTIPAEQIFGRIEAKYGQNAA